MMQPSTDRTRPTGSRLRFLVTPRWIALEIAVIAFALACYFLLAPWQFSRSSEHSAQQDEIAAALSAQTVPASELMSTDREPAEGAQWRKVTATGHFVPDSEAYIRLRHDNNGRPAYEVVAGFVIDNGASILVDRGYVSYTDIQEGGSAKPPPDGTVTIVGRVQQNQTDPKNRPPSKTPDGRQAYTAVSSDIVDLDTTYLGYVQLSGDSPGVIEPIALPEDNSRPFFSYAIQWLSFGAIAIIGLGYFIYREYVDPVDAANIYIDDGPSDPPENGPARSDGQSSVDAREPDRRRRSGRAKRFDKSTLYDS